MKRLFIITILALAFMQVNAQHTAGTHLPRANDEVKRQQVAYVAANEGTENTVWDFTQLECSGREGDHGDRFLNEFVEFTSNNLSP